MFRKKTAIILGAGASWHYGYPTGEELIKRVTVKAGQIARYFGHSHDVGNTLRPQYITDKIESGVDTDEVWKVAHKESQKLEAALRQTNPLVIDYFLGWNEELRSIGTLLIAWAI